MTATTTTTQLKRKRGRPPKQKKVDITSNSKGVEPKNTSSPKSTISKKEKPKTETIKTQAFVQEKTPTIEKTEKIEKPQEEPSIDFANDIQDAEVITEIEETMEKSIISEFDVDENESVGSDYSPLADPVVMRGYEGGNNPIATEESAVHIPVAQLTYEDDIPSQAQAATENNPTTTKEQPSSTPNGNHQTQDTGFSAASQSNKVEEKGFWDNSHSTRAETTTESPAEKRRNATKMADTLLLLYQSNVPLLFQYVAKFNEGKISKMELSGEIDLLMPIMDNGTTVEQYIKRVNQSVEETFVITDEQVAEVREPLIDYLMEKDFKMTPSQRLLAALVGQMFTLGIAAFGQWRQNRHALNQFSEFTVSWRRQNGGGTDIPHRQQQQQQNSSEDVARGYEAVDQDDIQEYQVTEEQTSTPYSNLSDLDGAEVHNLMSKREEDVVNVEAEEISNDERSILDMDSYLNEDEQIHDEDIPL